MYYRSVTLYINDLLIEPFRRQGISITSSSTSCPNTPSTYNTSDISLKLLSIHILLIPKKLCKICIKSVHFEAFWNNNRQHHPFSIQLSWLNTTGNTLIWWSPTKGNGEFAIYTLYATAMWSTFKITLLWIIWQWSPVVFLCHSRCSGVQFVNCKLRCTATFLT